MVVIVSLAIRISQIHPLSICGRGQGEGTRVRRRRREAPASRLNFPHPSLGSSYRKAEEESSAADLAEGFGEPVRMRTLGLRQRLEPVGDFFEAFLARGLGHAGIHVGVFVR